MEYFCYKYQQDSTKVYEYLKIFFSICSRVFRKQTPSLPYEKAFAPALLLYSRLRTGDWTFIKRYSITPWPHLRNHKIYNISNERFYRVTNPENLHFFAYPWTNFLINKITISPRKTTINIFRLSKIYWLINFYKQIFLPFFNYWNLKNYYYKSKLLLHKITIFF